jgi:hypothetical protein
MKKVGYTIAVLWLSGFALFSGCNNRSNQSTSSSADSAKASFGGFESREKFGEHLVLIGGCHDCHTPKKMTSKGPEIDFSLALSGHPAQMPVPDVNRKEMESKGLVVTQTLTSWVGPWGVSFAANLTPDPSGTGNWEESNFFTALRKGKHKGVETERDILPPMPWEMYQKMTDDELKAIFAYLKTIKPIKNVVPDPLPPLNVKP